jgi:hypothetical protein
MHDVNVLIDELDARMERDCRRLRKWRHVHRITAIFLNIIIILAPPLLVVGIISPSSLLGKILLMSITVTGVLTATFRPYTLSYKRRADMNATHRLRDDFRADVAKAELTQDQTALVAAYKQYSQLYSTVYEQRGNGLIEALLSGAEQREAPEKETAKVVGET